MKQVIAVATAVFLAGSASFADDRSDKQAFKEAYRQFQEASAAGRPWLAREPAKQAYELGMKIFGEDHANTAVLTLNYGRLVTDSKEARKILALAVKRYETLYGEDSDKMIDPLMALATKTAADGSLSGASRLYRRALKLAETHYPDNDLVLGIIHTEMGKIALHEAHSVDAMRTLKKAKKLLETIEDPEATPYLAETEFYMGQFQLAMNRNRKATKHLLASLEIYEDLAPNSTNTMTNHAFLIEAYEKMGKSDEATKHCKAIGAKSPQSPDQDYDPVYRVKPTYPLAAQRAGKEGYAIIEVTVDKDGFVQSPFVVEVDGHDAFAKSSLEAVQKFRYAPRYENGEAVDTTGVRYRFTYGLSNR